MRQLLFEQGGGERCLRLDDLGLRRGGGELLEVDEVLFAPLAPERLFGDLLLDVLVHQDAAQLGVDGDHAPGAEAAGIVHLGGEIGDEAGLGGEEHMAVVVDLEAGGAEAVAVEGGGHKTAVGKDEGGGAVPRFEQQRVVLEEAADVGAEPGVGLPGEGGHHHHGLQGGAAAEGQDLEDVVEAGRVGHAGLHDGVEVGEAVAPDAAGHGELAGLHAHAVAADGVDLAVVGEHAEGLGEVPGGEGVGGVPLVEDGEGRLVAHIAQVGEEAADLGCVEQALVDDGAGGEAADVEPVEPGLGAAALGHLLGVVELALELVVGRIVQPGHDGLEDGRPGIGGLAPEDGVVGRHLAPGDEPEPLLLHRLDDDFLDLGLGEVVVARQEEHADGEVAVFRDDADAERLEVGAEEVVGQLGQDPGAVARAGIGVDGPAVGQGLEGGEGVLEHPVCALAIGPGDEADTAGIVLEGRIVEGRRLEVVGQRRTHREEVLKQISCPKKR